MAGPFPQAAGLASPWRSALPTGGRTWQERVDHRGFRSTRRPVTGPCPICQPGLPHAVDDFRKATVQPATRCKSTQFGNDGLGDSSEPSLAATQAIHISEKALKARQRCAEVLEQTHHFAIGLLRHHATPGIGAPAARVTPCCRVVELGPADSSALRWAVSMLLLSAPRRSPR